MDQAKREAGEKMDLILPRLQIRPLQDSFSALGLNTLGVVNPVLSLRQHYLKSSPLECFLSCLLVNP